jgi:hypothetical protein
MQIITAAAHSISLFVTPVAANETERQLMDLMSSYVMDMGAGFHRSTSELLTALSSCFTLLYLFGGLLNFYVLRRKATAEFLHGLIALQMLVFGASFIIMLMFTFLPPIVLTAVVFICIIISWIIIRNTRQSRPRPTTSVSQ